MIDLIFGILHAVSEPALDVVDIVGEDLVNVIAPNVSLGSIAGVDLRRAIEVENRASGTFDPAAFGDQAMLDQHWLSWCPRHLLDWMMLIEPVACLDFDFTPALVEHWIAVRIHERNRL